MCPNTICLIYIGKGKLSELKKSVSMDQLVWHFALRNELVFRKLMDPNYMKTVLEGKGDCHHNNDDDDNGDDGIVVIYDGMI